MSPLLIAPIFELLKGVLGGLGLDPEAKARAQAQALLGLGALRTVEKVKAAA